MFSMVYSKKENEDDYGLRVRMTETALGLAAEGSKLSVCIIRTTGKITLTQ